QNYAGFSVLTTTTNHQHLQHQLYIVMSGKVSGKSKSGKAAATGTSQSRSATAGLQLPVGRIHRLLKKGNYSMSSVLALVHPVCDSLFLSQLRTDSFKNSI